MAAKKSTSKRATPPGKAQGKKPKKGAEPKPVKKSPGRGTSARARGVTVADYMATLPPEQLDIARKLNEIVKKNAPAARAELKWGQPVWEAGGPLAFLRGSKKHVTFGFWRGVELDDPNKLLKGDGTKMRHLKIFEIAKLDAAAIGAMVKQAAALNAAQGDPTARAPDKPAKPRSA